MTIPEADQQVLTMLCRLGEDDPLPEAVVAKYWAFKRIRDALSAGAVYPDVLAMVVLLSGAVVVPEPEPEAFDAWKEWQAQRVKTGDKLIVKWRNRELEATLEQATVRETCIVVLEGESQSREIKNENVFGILAQV